TGCGGLDGTGRIKQLAGFAWIVRRGAEQSERVTLRVQIAYAIEAKTIVQSYSAAHLPGILHVPLELAIVRVVYKFGVVVAVGEDAAKQRIRVRIAGVERTGSVGPKVIRSGRVVHRVHADIPSHALVIESTFDRVRPLKPGNLILEGLQLVGPGEGPAA